MESLTDLRVPPEARQKTAAQANDRATIGKVEALKLQSWIDQLKEATRGFLSISKSDLINFLIREHKDLLSAKETMQLRTLNYDPVKHISWISQELKSAFAKNDFKMVTLLQGELKQIELTPQTLLLGSDDAVKPASAAESQRRTKKRIKESADPALGSNDEEANFSNEL